MIAANSRPTPRKNGWPKIPPQTPPENSAIASKLSRPSRSHYTVPEIELQRELIQRERGPPRYIQRYAQGRRLEMQNQVQCARSARLTGLPSTFAFWVPALQSVGDSST